MTITQAAQDLEANPSTICIYRPGWEKGRLFMIQGEAWDHGVLMHYKTEYIPHIIPMTLTLQDLVAEDWVSEIFTRD